MKSEIDSKLVRSTVVSRSVTRVAAGRLKVVANVIASFFTRVSAGGGATVARVIEDSASKKLTIPVFFASLVLVSCGGDSDSSITVDSQGGANSGSPTPQIESESADGTIAADINGVLSSAFGSGVYCADVEPLNDGSGVPYNFISRQQAGAEPCDIPVTAAAPDSLLLPDAEEQRQGGAVAIDGRRLVVGGGYTLNFDSAANSLVVDHFPIRVFELSDSDEWLLTDLLQEDGNRSGFEFDISGSRIVVANRQANEAFVYEKVADGEWITSRLSAADVLPEATYGSTVAIDGDRVVIGTAFNGSFPHQTQHQISTESLYVYDRNANGDWLLTDTIIPSDFQSNTESGFAQNALDLDGDRIVAAADFFVSRCNSGNCFATDHPRNVYLFEKSSNGEWIETIINPTDTESTAGFGSVAIEGDLIAVGVPSAGPDQTDFGTGEVLLFRHNPDGVWQESRLIPSDATGGYLFGASVELADDLLIVSSPGEPEVGRLHSSVYLYGLRDNMANDAVQSETILSYLDPNSEIGSFGYSDSRLVVPELTLWDRQGPGVVTIRDIDNQGSE